MRDTAFKRVLKRWRSGRKSRWSAYARSRSQRRAHPSRLPSGGSGAILGPDIVLQATHDKLPTKSPSSTRTAGRGLGLPDELGSTEEEPDFYLVGTMTEKGNRARLGAGDRVRHLSHDYELHQRSQPPDLLHLGPRAMVGAMRKISMTPASGRPRFAIEEFLVTEP